MTPLILVAGNGVAITRTFDSEVQARDFAKSWLVGARAATLLGMCRHEPRAILPTVDHDWRKGLPRHTVKLVEQAWATS